MRKAVLALAACAFLATTAQAWAQPGGGVIAGVNFAKVVISGQDEFQPDIRTRFAVGLFATMPLADRVALEADVLYSQKGAKASEAGTSATITLDYLDVPVLARIAATGGRTRLAVLAGPSFAFKLRARTKAEVNGQTEEEDIGSNVSSFDFGLIVGAGVESGAFLVDGRYQWGLSNAAKTGLGLTEANNRVFSILVGMKF